MRLLASKMGMSLSEHALSKDVVRGRKLDGDEDGGKASASTREKLNQGQTVETPTEESVFEILGLPYRTPEERNH